MAERMKMICTGGPYGDASSSYVVKLDKEYTVQEFVKWCWTKSRENGEILR